MSENEIKLRDSSISVRKQNGHAGLEHPQRLIHSMDIRMSQRAGSGLGETAHNQ